MTSSKITAGQQRARCISNTSRETAACVDNAVQQWLGHVEMLYRFAVKNAENKIQIWARSG